MRSPVPMPEGEEVAWTAIRQDIKEGVFACTRESNRRIGRCSAPPAEIPYCSLRARGRAGGISRDTMERVVKEALQQIRA